MRVSEGPQSPSTSSVPDDSPAAQFGSLHAGPSRRRRRRMRWVTAGALVLALAAADVVYKEVTDRDVPTAMVQDTSCETEEMSVADMAQFNPGAASIRCESWDIGTGVTGYSWKAPDPRGVVLFQHGYTDYTQRWVQGANQMISHLLNEGFSVYGFDMWANGRSPGTQRGLTDVHQAIEDHLAARNKLEAEGLPIYMVGHSLGGLVTATSMTRDQDNIAGVALLAPAIKYDVGTAQRLLATTVGTLIPTVHFVGKDKEDYTILTADPAQQQAFADDPILSGIRMPWETAGDGARISHDNWSQYEDVNVPILAIHGTDDQSTDPTGSSDLIIEIGSDDKTLRFVEDGRHNLLDDAQPQRDETRDTLIQWLTERAPARS